MENHTRSNETGSSLISLSFGIVVVGLFTVAALGMYRQTLVDQRKEKTVANIALVNEALREYARVHNRYPCPAQLSAGIDTEYYGREAAACVESEHARAPVYSRDAVIRVAYEEYPENPEIPSAPCRTDIPAKKLIDYRAGGRRSPLLILAGSYSSYPETPCAHAAQDGVQIGTIPTRTLNLPDSAMVDGWGNRLFYAVTTSLTVPGQDIKIAPGQITIEDMNGNSATATPGNAALLLLSTGGDYRGAFSNTGVEVAPCAVDTASGENCNEDAKFIYSVTKHPDGPDQFNPYIEYQSAF